MEDNKPTFSEILKRIKDNNLPLKDERYKAYDLNFNPFPKSGTANIKTSFEQLKFLTPVNDDLEKQIEEYIVSTLFAETYNKDDKYMGATIIGNYGSGKTQMLLYVKYLLGLVAVDKEYHQNPYVIYIDNPGVRLGELIGKIISEISEENFKKFIWNKTIREIEAKYKSILQLEFPITENLFGSKSDPWDPSHKVNYKLFINAWLLNFPTKPKQREFEQKIREYIINILGKFTDDSVVGQYLFKVLEEDFGINTVWDSIIKGDVKPLTGKEANIIKFIVDLLYDEGFTHVYVLVDEFEDITRGRLNKSQVDNYLYSLRTLIDKERNWTIMFALTQEAFDSLEQASPALADRITTRKILIRDLTNEESKRVIANYLSAARIQDYNKGLYFPFEELAIEELTGRLRGNSRLILSSCFRLLEHCVETGQNLISKQIIETKIENIP
jgi:type II secretory pathway predicted ATPase ExeA